MKILLTGGRGHLGKTLTPMLLQAGHDVRVSSRSPKPNRKLDFEWAQMQIATGEGMQEAVDGIDVLMHLASTPTQAQTVDVDGTRRLLEASKKAGVAHFIFISIVGIDRVPFSYYKAKVAAENIICQSDVPWSILRATQFFPFIDLLMSPMNKMPIGLLPLNFQTQPIAIEEVAQRMVEMVQDGARGMVPDIGGPEVFTLREMAKDWLAVRGMRRPLVNIPVWGEAGKGWRAGYITTPSNRYGRITWREYLEQKYGRGNVSKVA